MGVGWSGGGQREEEKGRKRRKDRERKRKTVKGERSGEREKRQKENGGARDNGIKGRAKRGVRKTNETTKWADVKGSTEGGGGRGEDVEAGTRALNGPGKWEGRCLGDPLEMPWERWGGTR